MSNIINHIDKNWSKLRGKNIYVACSGGVDSTVLAVILKRLDFKVTVLHMNYQLRGIDSELDALFVKSFCRKERMTCLQRNVNLQSQLKDGGNLQELARNERYNWFQHIINQNENNFIALGHHQDDQVETFFLNLARKSGVMGLACMLKEHKQVIRPLLDYARKEIEQFAIEEGITWREDISNASNKYNRNKLRNVILPELRENLPNLNESVLTLVRAFQNEQCIIATEVSDISNQLMNSGTIPIKALVLLDDHKLIEFLRQQKQLTSLLEDFKGILSSEKGKKIAWGDSWLINDGESVIIDLKHEEELPQLIIESISVLPKDFDKNSIFLNEDKITGDLKVRKWQVGDRIKPIGMNGSKLISDIIKDAKIETLAKNNILVIHDDNCIHWCHQLTIGREAIASKDSSKIVKVSIS